MTDPSDGPDTRPCDHCGEPTRSCARVCSWDCVVAEARANGGREHLPNGLPVRSVRHDGLMLECGHGDHADYLFPVEVVGADHPEDVAAGAPRFPETHALIYTDGQVALTLYECCYFMWRASDGECLRSPFDDAAACRLSPAARQAIAAHAAKIEALAARRAPA